VPRPPRGVNRRPGLRRGERRRTAPGERGKKSTTDPMRSGPSPCGLRPAGGISRRSGAEFRGGDERVEAAQAGAGRPAQRRHLGRTGAVLPAGAAAARQPLGRARSGARPAVHPAAVVGHGRPAAGAPGAGVRAAARGSQKVARPIAVVEPPAAVARQRRRGGADGGVLWNERRHGRLGCRGQWWLGGAFAKCSSGNLSRCRAKRKTGRTGSLAAAPNGAANDLSLISLSHCRGPLHQCTVTLIPP